MGEFKGCCFWLQKTIATLEMFANLLYSGAACSLHAGIQVASLLVLGSLRTYLVRKHSQEC